MTLSERTRPCLSGAKQIEDNSNHHLLQQIMRVMTIIKQSSSSGNWY